MNALSGELMTIDEVIDIYGERLPLHQSSGRRQAPDWLTSLLSRVPVYFIEAERLSSNTFYRPRARRPGRETGLTPTVLLYAEDLSEKIKAKADLW